MRNLECYKQFSSITILSRALFIPYSVLRHKHTSTPLLSSTKDILLLSHFSDIDLPRLASCSWVWGRSIPTPGGKFLVRTTSFRTKSPTSIWTGSRRPCDVCSAAGGACARARIRRGKGSHASHVPVPTKRARRGRDQMAERHWRNRFAGCRAGGFAPYA